MADSAIIVYNGDCRFTIHYVNGLFDALPSVFSSMYDAASYPCNEDWPEISAFCVFCIDKIDYDTGRISIGDAEFIFDLTKITYEDFFNTMKSFTSNYE